MQSGRPFPKPHLGYTSKMITQQRSLNVIKLTYKLEYLNNNYVYPPHKPHIQLSWHQTYDVVFIQMETASWPSSDAATRSGWQSSGNLKTAPWPRGSFAIGMTSAPQLSLQNGVCWNVPVEINRADLSAQKWLSRQPITKSPSLSCLIWRSALTTPLEPLETHFSPHCTPYTNQNSESFNYSQTLSVITKTWSTAKNCYQTLGHKRARWRVPWWRGWHEVGHKFVRSTLYARMNFSGKCAQNP